MKEESVRRQNVWKNREQKKTGDCIKMRSLGKKSNIEVAVERVLENRVRELLKIPVRSGNVQAR